MNSSAKSSPVVGKHGIADRVFTGTQSRCLLEKVEAGLERIESNLEAELATADTLSSATNRYLFDAGGKRVRPMLSLLTAQLGVGATDRVIAAATALELTHLGSLYHDDVIDASDRRRGVPSAHMVWGNTVAILTGDLLFSRASRLMSRLGERAIKLHTETFERLVLGQMHESVGAQVGEDSVAFYLQVLSDKTGSLIAASAVIGSMLSEAPVEYETPLLAFGEKVGVAFQLLDDVLDLSTDATETGKVPGTDLRAGVPTMPVLLLGQRDDDASVDLRMRIEDGVSRIADGADPAILDAALAGLRDHEATRETLDLANSWSTDAIDSLSLLPEGPVREALTRFAHAVVDRTS